MEPSSSSLFSKRTRSSKLYSQSVVGHTPRTLPSRHLLQRAAQLSPVVSIDVVVEIAGEYEVMPAKNLKEKCRNLRIAWHYDR
jgi:hypothetical protein